jgi:hypothetical protein
MPFDVVKVARREIFYVEIIVGGMNVFRAETPLGARLGKVIEVRKCGLMISLVRKGVISRCCADLRADHTATSRLTDVVIFVRNRSPLSPRGPKLNKELRGRWALARPIR